MPMMNNDILKQREEIRAKMQKALKDNDTDAYMESFNSLLDNVCQEVRAEYELQAQELRQSFDASVLNARGVRQLTTEERKYYQKISEAMKSGDPRQAVANLDLTLPKTVVDSVFDDLEHNHPLLSHINFMPSAGAVKLLMNTNGFQKAVWGELSESIVTELASGFVEVDTMLCKLSAFILISKPMLDLGPEWLDRYIRGVLYEALANGMEYGLVDGTGKNMPIGMDRQVGPDVAVVDGVHPKKVAIPFKSLDAVTVGELLSTLAVDASGHTRVLQDVIWIVNPVDYYKTFMPATTIMAPDGTYRNNVLPYPGTIIPTPAVTQGEAIVGDGSRYFAPLGTEKEGRIEYSDHAKFLEDKRAYLIKAYANGMPKDNSSFLLLDISDLQPAVLKVQAVSDAAAAEAASE